MKKSQPKLQLTTTTIRILTPEALAQIEGGRYVEIFPKTNAWTGIGGSCTLK